MGDKPDVNANVANCHTALSRFGVEEGRILVARDHGAYLRRLQDVHGLRNGRLLHAHGPDELPYFLRLGVLAEGLAFGMQRVADLDASALSKLNSWRLLKLIKIKSARSRLYRSRFLQVSNH